MTPFLGESQIKCQGLRHGFSHGTLASARRLKEMREMMNEESPKTTQEAQDWYTHLKGLDIRCTEIKTQCDMF